MADMTYELPELPPHEIEPGRDYHPPIMFEPGTTEPTREYLRALREAQGWDVEEED